MATHGSNTLEKSRKRQKIARCMVRFNALNSSRPRTEAGQPVTSWDKRRCLTVYEPSRSLAELQRSNSDPDLYRRSQENLADQSSKQQGSYKSDPNNADNDDEFVPYTAVGSHEDIHNLSKQISVQELLSNIKDRGAGAVQTKPVPKPRKSIPSVFQDCAGSSGGSNEAIGGDIVVKESPKVKPKPLPRPSEEKLKQQQLSTTPKKTPPKVPSKPKVTSPKPAVKVLLPNGGSATSNNTLETNKLFTTTKDIEKCDVASNTTDTLKDSSSTTSTTINIQYTVSGENNQIKSPTRKTKQQNTKSKSFEAEPYTVVTLHNPNLHSDSPCSLPNSPGSLSDSGNGEYSEIPDSVTDIENKDVTDDKYLLPVDAGVLATNGDTPKSPQRVSASTNIKKSKTMGPTENRTSQMKSKSKSVVMAGTKTKGGGHNYRASLPEINNAKGVETARRRRTSEHDSTTGLCQEVVSPQASDDEYWNSDEFESTDEDESEQNDVPVDKPIPKLPHLEGTKKKLYQIVTEILTTERAYVKRLFLLEEIFNRRFKELASEDPNTITEKAVSDIFPFLPSIYQFHSNTLLPEIEKRINEWEETEKIGDIFLRLGHFLLLYQEYVKKFDNAVTTLNYWLKKSQKFNSIVEELQKDARCEHLSLQHHMLEPIQRVPRYKLLLADYSKRLPEDSLDQDQTKDALLIISKAAESSNNSMKVNDKFTKLLEIEDRIVDGLREGLILASREFIKEGELVKLAARSGNKNKRIIILFNDMLLCCIQTPTGKLRVRQNIDLYHLSIFEDTDLPGNSFSVRGRQKVLDFQAPNQEEMTLWISSIRSAVDEFEKKRGSYIQQRIMEDESGITIGQTAPTWVKDDNVSMCMLCAFKFGFINRKHHCRGCGRVVCGKCSAHKCLLAYVNKELRVCYACARKLGGRSGSEEAPSTNSNNDRKGVLDRDSDATSDMHGEVFWKAPGKEYKKEWVFLSGFVLYVQRKRKDIKAQFQLPLPSYQIDLFDQVEDSENPQLRYYLKIHKENKKDLSFFIASDDKTSINLWFNHLQCATQMQQYVEDVEDKGEDKGEET